MNLFLALLIATVIPTASGAPVGEPEKNAISFVVNNKEINCVAPPVIIDGRLLLSARDASGAFGKEINWDPAERSITIRWDDKTFKTFIGVKEIEINGVKKTIDVPPTIINGYTMLPARVIVEELGGKIAWNEAQRTASATYHFNGAAIFADYYDEQIAKGFAKKYEYGSGYEKIMFWSDEVLKDVKISAADYSNPSGRNTEHFKETLELNELFICNTIVPEGIPTQIISYTNSKGINESYWISYNGLTGGISLGKVN
jgi:hypothetical protein